MARTACLVCLTSAVIGRRKKETKNALEDVAQVTGTQQNLSNLYSIYIYVLPHLAIFIQIPPPLALASVINYDHK
jgi:hypothetical protein